MTTGAHRSVRRVELLGFAGSLRRNSHSKAVLDGLQRVLPSSMELRTFSLDDVPLYNATWTAV